ncbi:rod shape-determining protein MreC [Thiohalorhabdus denitrificans]|uniref:rod shape-determining protein MreC n=1 Tax=Thiohalorhabdus denitrificans TaxID=381306 RepID=UPI0015A2BB75|nr:rod shape-determining protein MreC [Thiohalorhabdus denitrificans]
MAATVLAALAVLLMGADSRLDWTEGIRSALLSALYPVQRVVSAPILLTQAVTDEVESHFQVHRKNEVLRKRLEHLEAENQELGALRRENERLRQLLNEAQRLKRSVSAAQIIAESPDPFHHTVTVSRGQRHGVHPGQPVLSAQGVVGQVSSRSPLSAQVILLTDPNSGIPVLVRDSRVRGILAGTGSKDKLELRYVPSSARVKTGDILVTSGLGGVFPKGIKAARVEEVVRDPHSPFAEITARPTVPVSRLEDVLLLEQDTQEPPEQARTGNSDKEAS